MRSLEAIAAAGWVVAVAGLAGAAALLAGARRRAELVARACHELAGPLNAAGLALHAASREAPAPRLAAVDLELRRVGRALEDLDAARAGRRARDHARVVDVGCLLAQQALAWQPAARAGGCELRVAAGANLLVQGDPVRIAQAVGNLLANAVEHGGGRRVELRAVRARSGVRIEVSDDGRGLPAPVDAMVARPRAGRGSRGRGLAIAAEIAAAHGGRLGAAPSPKGARLVIELPAAVERQVSRSAS
jgi:signal transduction histidine kinase